MEPIRITPRDVEDALSVVREVASHTPTVPFRDSDGGEVYLKLENLQRLGVFKIRGTWNRVSRLSPEERRRGLTTISSGNHGLSLAWAAKRLGVPCIVRVPEGAVARKVEAIRAFGAEVEPMPRALLVLFHEEEKWREWPQTFIHPFAHPHTIAGAGTLGWEIAEDAPDVRSVLVPVGGGGLVAGVAVRSREPGRFLADVVRVRVQAKGGSQAADRIHAQWRMCLVRIVSHGTHPIISLLTVASAASFAPPGASYPEGFSRLFSGRKLPIMGLIHHVYHTARQSDRNQE